MFIPPSPKSQLHGSNFVYMNVLGIHPVNSTLVMKKPPGIIENNNVYFHHKMCPLIYQFQSEKKIKREQEPVNWGLKYTEDKSHIRAISAHFSSASH